VLTHCGDLWFRAFEEMGAAEVSGYPRDYNHVDAANMWFVKNPEWFDVVVTENLFGDIITDLGAMIQGGLGVEAGGNINPTGISMFEPMGGSAPKYSKLNVINPIAAIGAAGMMLDTLGERTAAAAVEAAIMETTPKMKSQRPARWASAPRRWAIWWPHRCDGAFRKRAACRAWRGGRLFFSARSEAGEEHAERGALPAFGRQADLAAVLRDDGAAMLRPRPVPLPRGLVVKNDLKTRSCSS
jgi:hypothetical protein